MTSSESEPALDSSVGSWEALALLPEARFEKRFGEVAGRFLRASKLDHFPATWLLDKRSQRRVLEAVLPSRHRPEDILRDAPLATRSLQAARAYERLGEAETLVPALPLELREGSYLVWSSPALKPRGLRAPALVTARVVTRERIARAVCEIWARPYLGSILDQLPAEASRIELAVGVTSLRSTEVPPSLYSLLPEAFEAEAVGYPFPSLALVPRGVPPLVAELARERLQSALATASRLAGKELSLEVRASSTLSLPPERVERLLQRVDGGVVGSVLEELLGRPREGSAAKKGPSTLGSWLRLSQRALERAVTKSELVRSVEKLGEAVEEKVRLLAELDLAILPDDGLRTTIEQQRRLERTAATLAEEAHLTARFAFHTHAALSGIPVTHLDSGLSVPLLGPLLLFEEVLGNLRATEATVPDFFTRGDAGYRALGRVVERYPELFGYTDEEVPRALLEAATFAWSRPVDLVARCRQARAQFERLVLEREAALPKVVASALSPILAQSRELMVKAEEARVAELRAQHFLLGTFLEADRRLGRLESGLGENPAFRLSIEELVEALDMRGTSLRARTHWRRSDEGRGGASPVELGEWRALSRMFLLPYVDSFPFGGRSGDSVPLLARAIGASVRYRSDP